MIVVTGATGHIGRPLVGQLLAEGAEVRALTRDPRRAQLPAGAEVVEAQPGSAERLAELCRGARVLYLNLAATQGASIAALAAAAVEAGVRRIVLNSSISVEHAETAGMIARIHQEAEQAVRDSGAEWCFIRGGMYATNALAWAPEIRATGMVRGAYPDAVAAPVHEADLAAVTARALLDEKGEHSGKAYAVTGPANLTMAQQVAGIARAIGRPEVHFQQVPEREAVAALTAQGLPEQVAQTLVAFAAQSVGTNPALGDDIEPITGHPARTFAQWANDHAEAFR
ncbi:NmrA family NAD(P)-binding protein [Streptomyces orinoci]|uniref:NAD(P)H-binding protein n=1 Tax=Streptomyces orinoci TaxID=67339 RepID=A0ABV3JUU2_STRON|nr:NAD(P)H-binding protein [Streptomyces orinoci]